MASNNDAQIWGVMAASGSGKGLWIKDWLRRERPKRLIVWDYKDEYGDMAPTLVRNLSDVRAAMLKAKRGPLLLRYRCKPGTTTKQTMAEFEGLCRLVQAWGACTFIAEELSNVTTPGWAPAAWREMTTGGRHELIHIVGVAQNPALIDKTFLSNCTMVHVGPLREHRHRQAVARSMDVPVEKITALVQFQFLERDHNTRELREGWIYPPGHAPTRRRPSGSATGDAGGGRQGVAPRAMAALSPTPPTPRSNGK